MHKELHDIYYNENATFTPASDYSLTFDILLASNS